MVLHGVRARMWDVQISNFLIRCLPLVESCSEHAGRAKQKKKTSIPLGNNAFSTIIIAVAPL